ncbi:MAG TPA: M23 family metallopeptidase, partial [Candidatus Limosilactobacillus intestinipullorum]|nr:M23 family metallopeptidase [Candidatus Limosilactobacillus intestinipullorum]
MYTGVNYVDGHCYNFGSDGIARAQQQNDGWSWPFPAAGRGSFAPGQSFGYSSYKRTSEYPGNDRRNYYHDGLDFGAYDHPGSEVHAVHGAKVLDVNTCRNSNGETMWWYIIAWDGRYLYVYQEAFQTRAQIAVNPGQIIYPGQVIGWRNTSHLHLGINTSPNYGMDLSHSFQPSWSDPSAATGSGTWLDPQWVISHNGN